MRTKLTAWWKSSRILSLLVPILSVVSCGEAVEDDMNDERKAMVSHIRAEGVKDDRVLEAMTVVRRHLYIPEDHRTRRLAYGDHPCPIGYGQTISQPFIVAYMTQRIEVKPSMKILEIGTGSGYQAAVLAEMGADVYSIEIVPELAVHAKAVLKAEGYEVHTKAGDGYKGWPEYAPFDAIIVTCAPAEIPEALKQQLKSGGRMILPVGTGIQQLVVLEKNGDAFTEIPDIYVRFVPMIKGAD